MRENQKRLTMLTNSNLRTHNQFEHVTQTRLAKENQQLLWSSGAGHTTVPENICRVGQTKQQTGKERAHWVAAKNTSKASKSDLETQQAAIFLSLSFQRLPDPELWPPRTSSDTGINEILSQMWENAHPLMRRSATLSAGAQLRAHGPNPQGRVERQLAAS